MTPKPISLQLYTLRDEIETKEDFFTILEKVAEIGFKGVEPAGFYGIEPRAIRTKVEELGMVVSSSHGPWASPDNLQEVIDTAGKLGTDLVSSGFGPEAFATMDDLKKTVETVNTMCGPLADAGLELFLHNHWWEFEKVGDDLAYHYLAEHCPDVSFEIDTYWAANFGKINPVDIVRRYAHRAPLLHMKDGTLVQDEALLALGSGKMDVAAVVNAADEQVLQWLVVEIDKFDGDMLGAVAESYQYLVKSGLGVGNK